MTAILSRLLRPVARALRRRRYERALRRGEPAGDFTYVSRPPANAAPAGVDLHLAAEGDAAVTEAEARRWCAAQTLAELGAFGHAVDGSLAWRLDDGDDVTGPAPWFAAPGRLPDVLPDHLESAMLVAAGEEVDAVILCPPDRPCTVEAEPAAAVATGPELRRWALYRTAAYAYDPATDSVRARVEAPLVKLVDGDGVAGPPREAERYHRTRRGPYLCTADPGPDLEVGIRDAAALERRPARAGRTPVLVTNCFLARGGAEHTLLETMRVLAGSFDFSIATLAPHRPEVGDRRADFRAITPRIHCLGDLVHPAAMVGMLCSILDATGAEIIYNANGTTLFYDFAPELKARRPGLRIVDHLYDHRVGYIDRYQPELLDAVDACVAENLRIADELVGGRGWPAARVPVIWPCGRPRDELPAPGRRQEVRRRVRRELGLAEHDLVFLTAARMHPQKRPLDLVRLAERVVDLDTVHFLVVGGGAMEDEVDRAIAASRRGRIRRLPFRTDIPDLIVASDVGCLVSDYEGLPVFMLECLQLGRPFLGTDVGDIGEVLNTSGAGLVVDTPGDMDAMEAAVRRFTDIDEWAQMAERAAEVGVLFDPDRCAERYRAALLGEPLGPQWQP